MDYAWRDNKLTALIAQALLVGQALLCAAAAMMAWSRGLDPFLIGNAELILVAVQLIVYLAAIVVMLRWIYLAHANVRALGAQDMMGSPGWAVGWFFVPLVNLVMPFIMMRELWKASAHPRDWQAASAPAWIAIWWGFWVAAGLADVIAMQMQFSSDSEIAAASEGASFAANLLSIPAALLLVLIIARVQAMQGKGGSGMTQALQDRFS